MGAQAVLVQTIAVAVSKGMSFEGCTKNMAPRRSSSVVASLVAIVASVLVLTTQTGAGAFLPVPQVARPSFDAAPASSQVASIALLAPMFVGEAPAVAGEPPSVGDHWYWNLGIGSLHGETASIILLVFFLYVVFSLLGAGGSSRKSA